MGPVRNASIGTGHPRPEHEGLPLPRRYWAILALCFSTAAIVLDGSIATIALPTIARDLGIGASESVYVVTIYQLVSVIALIPMAALGDRFGLRTIYRAGLVLLTITVLLCFLVDDLPLLLVLRFAQAVGASLALSVSSALLREIYPVRILGRGLAINSMIVSIFTSIAPTLGGAILAYANWPMVFISAAPLAGAALMLSPAMPGPVRRSVQFDGTAALFYVVTIATFFGAIDSDAGFPAPARIAMFCCAVVSGTLLVQRERRAARPVIPVDLLARPLLALSTSGALIGFVASMSVLVMLPFRLHALYGFNTSEIGLMMSAWPLTTLVVSPVVGFLSDRVPAWIIGTFGMALAGTAMVLLANLADADPAGISWRLSLCGAGFACYMSSNMRLVLANSPSDRAASAGGLIATARLTGQSLGSMLAGAIIAAGWINQPLALFVPAGLTAIVLMLSLSRRAAL